MGESKPFKYEIKIDKKIISILGPHLYGDMASIITEFIANSYDADADNCWITLKAGSSPEVIIEDDGIGMTPEDINDYFLDIGHDRREERSKTKKGRKVFGRKGIGKLAAFSLSKNVELYSLKDDKKAGCIMNYEEITKYGKDPETISDKNILFDPKRLSPKGTGTRLELKNLQKNINTTYYYLINKIIRNFDIPLEEFKIHVRKDDDDFKTLTYLELKLFENMDTIVTIGEESFEKSEKVKNNLIKTRYKKLFTYDDYLKEGKKKGLNLPCQVEVLDKEGKKKNIKFIFNGWIGTLESKKRGKKLIDVEGATDDEIKKISITDNRITLFSRNRVGEYDVLPKIQTTRIYDSYIIGEIYVDIFEDDKLIDMAISNRRGYEETDERYRKLIEYLKPLVLFIVSRKAAINKLIREDKDNEESKKIQDDFLSKTKTINILNKKLETEEKEIIAKENYQFVRASKLAQNTRKILISHNSKNKEYGYFVMKIFEKLGVNIDKTFVFTSHNSTNTPHGGNIYEYLKNCFREDMYVIFLFSRDFYDSNICTAETGAAWATNNRHSNIVIDIPFEDIAKPIDNSEMGLSIRGVDSLDKPELVKFVKTVCKHTGISIGSDSQILSSIDSTIEEFREKLSCSEFCPVRKYQGQPICAECGNAMKLEFISGKLYYNCLTPKCKESIDAEIS